jgi:selenocysteine lyase/cysteine desulfurase
MLHSVYKVEVPIKTMAATLYVRISAHIYNVMEDYAVLAAAVQELQQQQQQQQQQPVVL